MVWRLLLLLLLCAAPNNRRVTGCGINAKMLTAQCRLIAAISSTDGPVFSADDVFAFPLLVMLVLPPSAADDVGGCIDNGV